MPEMYSSIQQQYPLSSRKFWKKMFESTAMYVILILILGIIIGAFVYVGTNKFLPALSAFLITALVCALLVVIPYSIYIKAYIRRYYYDINENFITIKKGVFAPTEIHVQLQKIQDVYVDQDLIDRMMGLYDVHIASATATSGMEAHIDGVNHEAAEGLKNLLLGKITSGSRNVAQSNNMPSEGEIKINLSQRISRNEFPIEGRWLFSVIGKSATTVLIVALVAGSKSIVGLLVPEGTTVTTTASSTQADTIGLTIWLLIFGIAAFVNIIYWILWRKNYYFEYLPDFILEKTQVIARSEKHVPYRTIQNVTVTQGIVERLLGICTVTIENAAQASSSKLTIPGQTLERGNKLVSLTNNITSQTKNVQVTGL